MKYAFPKNAKAATDAKRPKGYWTAMIEGAEEVGDSYMVTEAHRMAVFDKFFRNEPTYEGMTTEQRFEAGREFWRNKGYEVRSMEEIRRVYAICQECPGGWFIPERNAGFGECASPSCNCSKGMALWSAKKCPKGFWRDQG